MPESYDNLKADRDRLRKELSATIAMCSAALRVKPKRAKKKQRGAIPSNVPLVPVLCQWPADWVAAMDDLVKRDGYESRAAFIRTAVAAKIARNMKGIVLSSAPSWGFQKNESED